MAKGKATGTSEHHSCNISRSHLKVARPFQPTTLQSPMHPKFALLQSEYEAPRKRPGREGLVEDSTSAFIFPVLFPPIAMALTVHTIPPSLAFSFVTNKSVRTGGGKDAVGYFTLGE
jgi:hypothetical protein